MPRPRISWVGGDSGSRRRLAPNSMKLAPRRRWAHRKGLVILRSGARDPAAHADRRAVRYRGHYSPGQDRWEANVDQHRTGHDGRRSPPAAHNISPGGGTHRAFRLAIVVVGGPEPPLPSAVSPARRERRDQPNRTAGPKPAGELLDMEEAATIKAVPAAARRRRFRLRPTRTGFVQVSLDRS